MDTRPIVCAALLFAACSTSSPSTTEPAKAEEVTEETSPSQTRTESEEAEEPASRPATRPTGVEGQNETARRVFEAAGGDALEDVAQMQFRFVLKANGKRAFEAWHRWDRASMRDRVQWTDKEGRRIDAMVDLKTKSGWVLVDGEPATGDQKTKLLDAAHGRWVNDSYWLAMPLKVLDPGATVEASTDFEPPEGIDTDADYEVLRLSFDEVGRTPGDRYWLFVNPDTNRVDYWVMQLEGKTEAERVLASWTDYREVGPLTLAHERAMPAGKQIVFEDVEALDHVQPVDFEHPTK